MLSTTNPSQETMEHSVRCSGCPDHGSGEENFRPRICDLGTDGLESCPPSPRNAVREPSESSRIERTTRLMGAVADVADSGG